MQIASNKIVAQKRADKNGAASSSQRQIKKESAAQSAPASKLKIKAKEGLKKDDSKETLGTNSQGSQANFAPLPSFQKFGLERPTKNPSNINILELL